jgi:sucrose 6(F)-phosphate phosphorylase
MRNSVQLITYPDSLGGDLRSLGNLLFSRFADLFGGVHILPPYPSSGDRGFAPRTYFEIDPAFGDWSDIRRIGEGLDVLVDVMVNHISRRSPYFQDFQQKGRRSEYADLFITLDKIWPGGIPRQEDVNKIFLRRPIHPFADIPIPETGQVERVWATFGTADWSEQIDLDVNSPVTRRLFTKILAHMRQEGVSALRLDAIAFVTKKPGTSCFFIEPEIYHFLDWIKAEAERVGIELLPELHARFDVQMKLAHHGEWVYNFVLPLLTLHALLMGTSHRLAEHLRACPRKQITMLDCHDGIPVQPDLDGILEIDEAQRVVATCLERGANLSQILSEAHKLRPDFDAHQINITYYSALGANDDAYIAARAIQFFAPGIPQVYYVGLLAGENAPAEIERTGERRAINRHNFTLEEVDKALEKPVVQRLMQLIRFRNQHPAFAGGFSVLPSDDSHLILEWMNGESHCRLTVDLSQPKAEIEFTRADGNSQTYTP